MEYQTDEGNSIKIWTDNDGIIHEQNMQYADETVKGMKTILIERGLWPINPNEPDTLLKQCEKCKEHKQIPSILNCCCTRILSKQRRQTRQGLKQASKFVDCAKSTQSLNIAQYLNNKYDFAQSSHNLAQSKIDCAISKQCKSICANQKGKLPIAQFPYMFYVRCAR
jgi:hypothetical protein